MKTLLLLTALLAVSCKTTPVTPPPPAQAQTVYQELVDAGCLAASDSGVADIVEEQASDAAPSWFTCLWNGGTITTCQVPCGTDSTKKK